MFGEMVRPESHHSIVTRSSGESHHAIYSHGQDKPVVIIGVLSNEIDTSRRPGRSYVACIHDIILKYAGEPVKRNCSWLWCLGHRSRFSHSSTLAIASRNSWAFCCGVESLVHSPQIDSEDAAYFNLPGARPMASISTCR